MIRLPPHPRFLLCGCIWHGAWHRDSTLQRSARCGRLPRWRSCSQQNAHPSRRRSHPRGTPSPICPSPSPSSLISRCSRASACVAVLGYDLRRRGPQAANAAVVHRLHPMSASASGVCASDNRTLSTRGSLGPVLPGNLLSVRRWVGGRSNNSALTRTYASRHRLACARHRYCDHYAARSVVADRKKLRHETPSGQANACIRKILSSFLPMASSSRLVSLAQLCSIELTSSSIMTGILRLTFYGQSYPTALWLSILIVEVAALLLWKIAELLCLQARLQMTRIVNT